MLEQLFKYFCDADRLMQAQEVVEAYEDFVGEVGTRFSTKITRSLAELSRVETMPWRVDRERAGREHSIRLVPDGRLAKFQEEMWIGIRWYSAKGLAGDTPWYACWCTDAAPSNAAFDAFRSQFGSGAHFDGNSWAYAYLDENSDAWPNMADRGKILKLVEEPGRVLAEGIARRLHELASEIAAKL